MGSKISDSPSWSSVSLRVLVPLPPIRIPGSPWEYPNESDCLCSPKAYLWLKNRQNVHKQRGGRDEFLRE